MTETTTDTAFNGDQDITQKPPAETPPVVSEPERRIEYIPINELVQASRNPKRHDLPTLRKSVERFGYVEPVTIDERTGRLVSGHGRTQTLRDLQAAGGEAPSGVIVLEDGRWAVPVTRGWASTSDEEAEGYIVAANRTVELGGWDDSLLDDILADVAETPGALIGVGFEAPIDDIPSSKVENLTALRWSHVLISYPVDEHQLVAEALRDLERNEAITIRATVNDARPV
jgi:hypothetical protein